MAVPLAWDARRAAHHGSVSAHGRRVFHKRACDLDNSLKIILDVLQKPCYVIDNDNQCAEIHARKLIDRANPRIEFTIETLI